jgi:hypothetical protein
MSKGSPQGLLFNRSPKALDIFFSRMRVQVAAAIAKAAAARFVQDDVDDGLPIHTMYERKVADRAFALGRNPGRQVARIVIYIVIYISADLPGGRPSPADAGDHGGAWLRLLPFPVWLQLGVRAALRSFLVDLFVPKIKIT